MDLGLRDKAVIVMASSGGLGKAMACEMAREGARVMLCSSSRERVEMAREEIAAETGTAPLCQVCDVTRVQDIERLVAETVKAFGSVYALVGNSGGPPTGTFDAFDDATWQKAYELTLLSYVRAIRAVLPHMRAAGAGRILLSTSSSIKSVLDNLLLSNTFRAGVVGLAKTLSQELGPDGILVNVIAPGRIATARIDQLDRLRADTIGVSMEELQQQIHATIPLGRYGEPAEYGKLAAFLCSEANTYITGQAVLVDGGLVKAL